VIVTQASGCTYTLSSTSETFGSAGGTGTVMVTTFTACAWTAVSNVPWITVLAGESESGPGTVVYTVMPLVIGKRSGSITIAGQTFFVSQPN
jgi:hypothetical protein